MAKDNTTPRSYTLRLRGTDNNDRTWREHLWRTHAAVNLGAKIFGDFLLTFCGGISHKIVDEFAGQKDMGATKDRRIILALSWLSVEDRAGAPENFSVKKNDENGKYETVAALRKILDDRGLDKQEIESWVEDCRHSLEAAIREDAVWVNRAKAFRALQKEWKLEIDENDLWDFLGRFLTKKVYMQPKISEKKAASQDTTEDEPTKAPPADEAKDMAQAALGWLSNRFGSGEGADYEKLEGGYQRIADWAAKKLKTFARSGEIPWEKFFVKMSKEAFEGCDMPSDDQFGILTYMTAPGRDSGTVILIKGADLTAIVTEDDIKKLQNKTKIDAEKAAQKIGGKGPRKYSDRILKLIEQSIDVEYRQNDKDVGREIFCVMLDHAARKIISRLSWIKLAEVRRSESESGIEKFRDFKKENAEIVALLHDYCQKRSEASNADDEYRIRKAALGGWKEVVAAWKDCADETKRIDNARNLQDNENIKKFGDINLFTDLADEQYKSLWDDHRLLENYATGQQAEFDQRRFKVPAYRHPDPLKHPVYCDYGKSRPGVSFSALERFKTIGKSKPTKKTAKNAAKKPVEKPELRHIRLDLIDANDGSLQQSFALRWQGKRLAQDIGLGAIELSGGKTVEDIPRFDRFGQSDTVASEPRALAIYQDDTWNSRLQVSRKELDQLAKVVEKDGGNPFDKTTWDEKALKMLRHLKWFVSFSPKLRYPDTWNRYLNSFPKANVTLPPYFRNETIHFGIGRLSGIPHLRILAMDLGHRFGASCAVWEVVSKEEIEKAAAEQGLKLPENALFFHLKTKDNKTIVFRRIADDSVKDACWARLERQFTIKLQGEDDAHKPRKTTKEEITEAKKFLKHLGRELSSEDEKKLNHIDSQLTLLVNTTRLALRRHGDLIRVARDIVAKEKIMPGNLPRPLEDAERSTFVLNAIRTWFNLRQTRRWDCHKQIDTLWKEHITPLMSADAKELDAIASAEKKKSDDELSERSPQKRKADQKTWDEAFQPVADALLKQGQKKLNQIAAEFNQVWQTHDDELRQRMREIRRLIMPRQGLQESEKKKKITKEFRKKISRRGGLSMGRINLIRELYQVAKAFYMRPGGDKDKIERGDDSIKNFGQRILKAHEELRRNRVKQLASRIVEAALGLGQEKKPVKFNSPKTDGKNTLLRLLDQKRDRKAPTDPRFTPCHAIVIENLDNYRPDQKQTRRENKGLIKWASGKIRDLLKEHCQLYGLFLMEVDPKYTSQQDSRTGKPGRRCKDIPAIQFKEPKGYLKAMIARIEKKKEDRSPREKLILAIAKKCEKLTLAELKNMRAFRIPWQGGDLFVATGTEKTGIQADLNAAANIGLKALTNQESPIAHWRVACDRKNGTPVIRKEEKYEILKKAKGCELLTKEQLEKAKGDNNVNAWRDVSTDPLNTENWEYTVTYWRNVEKDVCEKLAKYNKLDDDLSF